MWNRFVFLIFKTVFGILAKVRSPKFDQLPKCPSRILIFSTAGIGDSLTDSVAIKALKETYPTSYITVVTHRNRRIVHDHNPYINQVIPHNKSPLTFLKTWSSIKSFNPDLVVILRSNDPDIWPLAYLANRSAIVSSPRMTKFDFLISHPVPIPNWDNLHGVEQTLEIVRSCGADTCDRKLVYTVNTHELISAEKKFHGWIHNKPLLILQLGGGKRAKWRDWPAERFIELINLLKSEDTFTLVLTGGMDQSQKALEITTQTNAIAHNLAGRVSLAETAALLKKSFALVSTDTGVMHLGFAVGTNVIALIHGNNPAHRVGPYDYAHKHQVIQVDAQYNSSSNNKASMSAITPQMVLEKIHLLTAREQTSFIE